MSVCCSSTFCECLHAKTLVHPSSHLRGVPWPTHTKPCAWHQRKPRHCHTALPPHGNFECTLRDTCRTECIQNTTSSPTSHQRFEECSKKTYHRCTHCKAVNLALASVPQP